MKGHTTRNDRAKPQSGMEKMTTNYDKGATTPQKMTYSFKTKYRLFLVAPLYGNYSMPVMFSFCLIGNYTRKRAFYLMRLVAKPISSLVISRT